MKINNWNDTRDNEFLRIPSSSSSSSYLFFSSNERSTALSNCWRGISSPPRRNSANPTGQKHNTGNTTAVSIAGTFSRLKLQSPPPPLQPPPSAQPSHFLLFIFLLGSTTTTTTTTTTTSTTSTTTTKQVTVMRTLSYSVGECWVRWRDQCQRAK